MRQDIYSQATWYEATAQRGASHTSLDGEHSLDVCVIGGGLAGLTTALELARKGMRVALVEARLVGMGASGRNGGFVFNGFAQDMGQVDAHVGKDAAVKLYEFSKMGTEYVRSEIASSDPSIKMGEGLMVTVRYDDGGGLERYGESMAREYGDEVSYLNTDATRQRLASLRYHGALFYPRAFHIHPLRYCLSLKEKIIAAGGKVFENSPVLSVEKAGSGFLVKCASGSIKVAHVVHCVSSLGRNIHRPSGRAVLPVATYIGVTEPLTQQAINAPCAVADTRRAGDYYRLIDDGRILWGGLITTNVSPPARLAEKMKGIMLLTYPQLGTPKIDYVWAGLMGYALHKMPLIGRDQEGQWFGTAFGGHGLNTTAMAGILLARAIADGDDSYRQFAPFAPDWAYGQLGRLGVQGAYWWMQARDKWDESRRKPRQ
jgi:glycine/D-amino acid oxidase-like deaminating enzyme